MILTKLFVEIDDFMKEFEVQMKQQLIGDGTLQRDRDNRLSMSEIMTIIVYFQMSDIETSKTTISVTCPNIFVESFRRCSRTNAS